MKRLTPTNVSLDKLSLRHLKPLLDLPEHVNLSPNHGAGLLF